MKSDVEIAQAATMLPITKVAAELGLTEDDIELYGKYKAKVSLKVWDRVKERPNGKLVLVTAINPTPAGEGKTTTTVGLGRRLPQAGQEVHHRPARALPGPLLRRQGWAPPAAVTPRLCPWRTSTSTSPATSMP